MVTGQQIQKTTPAPTPEPVVPDPADGLWEGAQPADLDESDRMAGTTGTGTAFVKIAQATGKNVELIKNAGKFYTYDDEGGLVFYEGLQIIPLEAGATSTRWDNNDVVQCRSYNGHDSADGQICKECVYHPFKKNDIDRNDKCKNFINLLCLPAHWEVDEKGHPIKESLEIFFDSQPFFFQISAGMFRDWKDFAADIQNRHKWPVFGLATGIGAVLRQQNKGTSYVPVFRPAILLNLQQIAAVRAIRIAESYRFRPSDPSTGAAPTGNGQAAADGSFEVGSRDPFVNEG